MVNTVEEGFAVEGADELEGDEEAVSMESWLEDNNSDNDNEEDGGGGVVAEVDGREL